MHSPGFQEGASGYHHRLAGADVLPLLPTGGEGWGEESTFMEYPSPHPSPHSCLAGRGRNFCWLCQDAPLSGLSARDAEPLHLGDQRRALQSEPAGGAFRASDDPVGFSQCLDDMLALGIS